MELLHAFVLAIVQGVTEFLPVSSSAHLILVPEVLGWSPGGLAFDVAVHVGTLFAVIAFLRAELKRILTAWMQGFNERSWSHDGLLGWMLIIATVPVGLVGLLAGGVIEAHLRTAYIIAVATFVFALLLGWSDRNAGQHSVGMEGMSFKHAILVGLAQVFALIPGTSRSGVTMTALLALGYERVAAAKFSFLLAVPTIALPGLLKTGELVNSAEPVAWMALAVGVVVSALVAFFSMHWFIEFVTRVGMRPFVIYRIILAAVIFALLF